MRALENARPRQHGAAYNLYKASPTRTRLIVGFKLKHTPARRRFCTLKKLARSLTHSLAHSRAFHGEFSARILLASANTEPARKDCSRHSQSASRELSSQLKRIQETRGSFRSRESHQHLPPDALNSAALRAASRRASGVWRAALAD